jgi:hypothetical protein
MWKRFIHTFVVLGSMLLAQGTVQASDWVSLGKNAMVATEGLVDVSSIVITGDIRRAWFKLADLHNKSYTVERDAFDCAQQIMRAEVYDMYHADGTVLDLPPLPEQPWKPIPPDTMGSRLMEFVCAWKPKRHG